MRAKRRILPTRQCSGTSGVHLSVLGRIATVLIPQATVLSRRPFRRSRLSVFNIVIFGLLFGTGYVLTGELALPIGLHYGWDFVQGFVFGVVASGRQYGSVLVLADDSSATLWTGRPYGAEGGLIGTAPFIAGFLATFAWARAQHRAPLPLTPPHP